MIHSQERALRSQQGDLELRSGTAALSVCSWSSGGQTTEERSVSVVVCPVWARLTLLGAGACRPKLEETQGLDTVISCPQGESD